MGFDEPWLREDADEVIRGILTATARHNPLLNDMTLERLQAEGSVPIPIPEEQRIPFAGGTFRTPSGKVEIYSAQAAAKGYDPVPGWEPEVEAAHWH